MLLLTLINPLSAVFEPSVMSSVPVLELIFNNPSSVGICTQYQSPNTQSSCRLLFVETSRLPAVSSAVTLTQGLFPDLLL